MKWNPETIRKNVIPDISDNLSSREPLFIEGVGEQGKKLLERMIPKEKREQLLVMIRDFEEHSSYQTTTLVGEKKKRTQHPHLFVIERGDNHIQLFFVDPEHNVGKQNTLRPRIGNLMSLKIYEGNSEPELAILRFRTPEIEDKDITLLKIQPQLEAARALIENEGVPQFLEDFREEILFRIVVRHDKSVLQARYTKEQGLKSFLEGGKGSSALEGKVDSQNAIIDRFVRFLEEKKFKKVESK